MGQVVKKDRRNKQMSVKTVEVVLTEEQNCAVDWLSRNVFRESYVTLAGFGGTGKTTVIKTLLQRLPGFAPAAYTGKAAEVLRRKGVGATTIHSLIYAPSEVEWWDEKEQRNRKRLTFSLKTRQDKSMLPVQGFVIDEASMVSSKLHDDLLSFCLPLVYVGDHGQLEPVFSEGGFNLMAEPDVKLEKIHRNAGEISRFAQYLRNGGNPGGWYGQAGCDGSQVELLEWNDLTDEKLLEHDQAICAFNITRVEINKGIRRHLGKPESTPVVGDRVMCLDNSKLYGVFNGMQGVIVAFGKEDGLDTLVFRCDGIDREAPYVPEQLNKAKKPEDKDPFGRIGFDYSWCVSCHKFQGSEDEKVLVLGQSSGRWSMKRWNYTAASRAKSKLTWVLE